MDSGSVPGGGVVSIMEALEVVVDDYSQWVILLLEESNEGSSYKGEVCLVFEVTKTCQPPEVALGNCVYGVCKEADSGGEPRALGDEGSGSIVGKARNKERVGRLPGLGGHLVRYRLYNSSTCGVKPAINGLSHSASQGCSSSGVVRVLAKDMYYQNPSIVCRPSIRKVRADVIDVVS